VKEKKPIKERKTVKEKKSRTAKKTPVIKKLKKMKTEFEKCDNGYEQIMPTEFLTKRDKMNNSLDDATEQSFQQEEIKLFYAGEEADEEEDWEQFTLDADNYAYDENVEQNLNPNDQSLRSITHNRRRKSQRIK